MSADKQAENQAENHKAERHKARQQKVKEAVDAKIAKAQTEKGVLLVDRKSVV